MSTIFVLKAPCDDAESGSITLPRSIGDTIRVEMAPLGVKVLTIIPGNIGTNILKHDAHRILPPSSYYSPLASEFQEHVRRKPKITPRSTFAKDVSFRNALKSSCLVLVWRDYDIGQTCRFYRI